MGFTSVFVTSFVFYTVSVFYYIYVNKPFFLVIFAVT